MAKKKKQRYSGVVYSTDPSFEYEASEQESSETLENHLQQLVVCLDKKARKGKQVTLVQGFVGDGEDLRRLSSLLKQKCAVGGSVKNGEVIIQGDFRQRIQQELQTLGYNVKLLR